jgi:hypothetical protein
VEQDEKALVADLKGNAFRLGALRGKWKLEQLRFPYAYFRISAPRRQKGPAAFLLRVECNGYRAVAPTSQLWDGRSDQALPLNMRPHGRTGVLIAFSDWQSPNGPCLYHPIDRCARDHWPNQFSDLAWKKTSDINSLLETVHALVNDPEYLVSNAPDDAAYLHAKSVEDNAA